MAEATAGRPIDPKKVQTAQNALVLSGGNVPAAAKACGMQARTIHGYINRGLIDPTLRIDGIQYLETLELLTQERNEKLATSMFGTAEKAVDQANRTLVDASAQQAATVAGIMVQNSRLLQDKSTSNVSISATADIETLKRLGIISIEEPIVDAEVVEET